MNRYELDKLNKEVKRLTMENEGLANRIDELVEKIKLLEHEKIRELEHKIERLEIELDRQYNEDSQIYNVAKAVHEMQNDLKKLHPELTFNNNVYAPDKVGGF